MKVIKRGFSPAVETDLAHLGVFLKNFGKETALMNLCNVNGKVPDLKRHHRHPTQVNIKRHDQLQQNLSNARMSVIFAHFL